MEIAPETLEIVRIVGYSVGIVLTLTIFSVWMAKIIKVAI